MGTSEPNLISTIKSLSGRAGREQRRAGLKGALRDLVGRLLFVFGIVAGELEKDDCKFFHIS